ncbi:MAG: S9 family peptidase [Planctomycetes bacterium]|nr:S9 family peptidase [Planctomycetota bacterium]MBI3833790.1 S9 family peptidase [Planctomycetota bacterium]
MHVRKFLIAIPIVAVCSIAAATDTKPHPFSIHDMLAMKRISDPDVSPDGKRVVFTVRTTDIEANKGRTDLWLVNVDGTGLRQLTSDPANDGSGKWSPDGKSIYFVSSRGGSSQIWRIAPDGGEAEKVTNEPLDVGGFVISRDGNHLAYSMEVFPDLSPADTKKKLDEKAKEKVTGQLYDHLFIRHWDTWANGTRSHLFVAPIGGGTAVDVMKGVDADSPSKPFGGSDEFTFTPDGKSIVYTARDVGREEAWSTNLDLFVVPIDGAAKPKCLTSSNKATDTRPTFSPDGKTLAYLAMSRPGYEADQLRIMIKAWPDGATKDLVRTPTSDWDVSVDDFAWSPDGKMIYATAENRGQKILSSIEVASGSGRPLVMEGTVSSLGLAGEWIVYQRDDLKSPVELYALKSDGSESKQITNINKDQIAAARMGECEQFSFEGANGDKVYGYSVKPADFDASKKYPIAFLIHGGPQGSFGNHFHYRWNPQAYAGAGYAVVMIDFHGSTGYGQAFCDAIRGDWGGGPLEDLKKGLDAALKKYPWMDGDRVGALGASFGGYMINWIAGNWPDRFKCLVCHDGNLDEKMAYYDTEELWFPEWDHQGLPWEQPEHYGFQSPINFVKNWKTPMLVIHGGQDFRVVATHGMGTFAALQRRGIPSKFLYFPDENHWVLKPANSILWHDTVIGWLDQWTKK